MSTNTDIKITLSGDSSNFTSAFKKAEADFKAAMDAIAAESKKTKSSLDDAFSALKIRSGNDIAMEGAKIKAAFDVIKNSADATALDVARASDAMNAKMKELGKEVLSTSPHFNEVGNSASNMGTKFAGAIAAIVSIATAIKGIKDVMSAGMGFEQLNNQLIAATGSSTAANSTYAQLRETARSLGVSFTDVSKAAIGFISATKGTSMEGQKALDIFKGFSTLGAATGRSNQDMERTFVGLQQIIAKGTITAEEWKGQIGDALPSANAYLQKALGKTQQELMKMMETGSISSEVLVKVAAAMQLENAAAGAKNAETLQGKMNLLKDTLNDFYIKIANSSAMDAFKGALDRIQARMEEMARNGDLEKMAKSIGEGLASLVTNVAKLGEVLANNAKEIAAFAAVVGGIVALSAAITVIRNLAGAFAFLVATVGGGAAIMAAGLAAIPWAGLAVVVGTVGLAVYKLVNAFTGSSVPIKEAENALQGFKNKLDDIGKTSKIDLSKMMGDNDSQLAARLDGIEQAFKQRFEKINATQEASSVAFSRTMANRQRETEAKTDAMFQAEKALKDKLEAQELAKSKADQARKNQDLANERATLTQRLNDEAAAAVTIGNLKNKTIADEHLLASQHSKDMSQFAKDAAANKIAADKEAEKKFEDGQKAQTKAASDGAALRALAEKEAQAAVENSIERTKNAIKEAEKERENYSKNRGQGDAAILAAREQELTKHEQRITAMINQEAKAREQVYKEWAEAGLSGSDSSTEKRIKAIEEEGRKNAEMIRTKYDLEAKLGEGWLEKLGIQTSRKQKLHEQADAQIVLSNKATVEATIKAQQEEINTREGLLKTYENMVKASMDRIKGLQESQDTRNRAEKEKQFDISLQGLSKEEEASKRITHIEELKAQALKNQGEMVNKTGDDLIKAKKAQEDIASAISKQGDALAGLADKTKGGILDLNYLKGVQSNVSQLATNIRNAMDTLDQKMEASKVKGLAETIAKTTDSVKVLKEELAGMQKAFEINPKITPEAIGKIRSDIKEAMNFDAKLEIQTNIKDIMDKLEKAAKPYSATIEVKVKDSDVAEQMKKLTTPVDKSILPKMDEGSASAYNTAISNLTAPRTQYVNIVTRGGSGGDVQMNAAGGLIQGEGTGTSDSILSFLSNGEYVVKASSVQKFGANFFNALNSGFMPPAANTPRFATGGLVGGSEGSKGASDTVNINLSIGSKQISLQGAREQAMTLANALQQLSRAA